MNKINTPWAQPANLDWSEDSGTFSMTIDLTVYSLDAVLKTCYLFLDEFYVFIDHAESPDRLRIYLSAQNDAGDFERVLGEFSNRLLWQEVRQKVADETRTIREIIVMQAFTEAGIEAQTSVEADYILDPLGIAE
jgi:His-Xaa-Ser system protein HxsD